ncbi:MAG: acetyl-CoA carboxylase biotin carboxyl carrier protein [Acidobacteriota bacterium]|nr:acetyl-CoA carboxylase biotin carboxyl carrier protein [Acidobacteriota bacterium]
MNIDEIRELIQLLSDSGMAELEVQRGDNRVRIRKSVESLTGGSELVVHTTRAAAPLSPPPLGAPAEPGPATPPSGKPDPEIYYAKSPIVGTFYESASPETPPFVRIGEHVTPGKVLCIIESMKLMNEIEAEIAGIIESKLVQNGQPVEYGEALFAIRPV